MMTTYERIKDYLNSMEPARRIYIHNQYCEQANYPDDTIYSMDDFNDVFTGKEPWEIARTCYYGDFCPAHDWFWFNGYGNAVSGDFPEIDTGAIADYILETMDSLGADEIEELLESEV